MSKKRKSIALIIIPSLLTIGLVAVSFNSKPHASSPIATVESPKSSSAQDSPTSTERRIEASQSKDSSPDQAKPVARTTAPTPMPTEAKRSPKQAEIRENITKEYTYYPMMSANDPGYQQSGWALEQVRAPEAWNISTGSPETTVAVIDSGFALNHEDLRDKWHINVNETGQTTSDDHCWTGVPVNKQSNNCDDDRNGYVDDWRGWNFYLFDNDVSPGRTNPYGMGVSHGTETAGLVGASGNNKLGIAAISWSTRIMPLQVLSDDGPGYTSDVVAAIYYAVDNGADVINMSLGGYEYDSALVEATNYAYSHNVPVIAAAGNCGSGGYGCEGVPVGAMGYPALNPHVISVGASNEAMAWAEFSSYGPELDIAAPGAGSIYTPTWHPTDDTSLYMGSIYGTSYASPQVASLAALIKSIRPNSSASDIEALLLATATKPASMGGELYTAKLGHGIINAYQALIVTQSLNQSESQPTLLQAGSFRSEHGFRDSDLIGSGCEASNSGYCTIRFTNELNKSSRYLPYIQTSQTGKAGWTWQGKLLGSGTWWTRAVQGDNYSESPYLLMQK